MKGVIMATTVLITNGVFGVSCFKTLEECDIVKEKLNALRDGTGEIEPGHFVDIAKSLLKQDGEDLPISEHNVDLVFDMSGVCFTIV